MSTHAGVHAPLVDLVLDAAHEAHEPPEARGVRRDQVRLLVSPGSAAPVDTRFDQLGAHLRGGDVLVVNTSATLPAALDGRLPDGDPVVVHVAGRLPGGVWLVEVRHPAGGASVPARLEHAVDVELLAAGHVRLLARFEDSARLWVAQVDVPTSLFEHLRAHGRPIRYRHVRDEWPVAAYQTVFAREPGSAEMPSAARPFSVELVTDLVTRGVSIAPLVLHTGVSSLEGDELPAPEPYRVPEPTAAVVNAARQRDDRVVAVGTTVVRALATVTDARGVVHPGTGWTDVVVRPDDGLPALDGLITGWHEPESTHLMMLEAVAGRDALRAAYAAAWDLGYRWHEFGDSHLILREDRSR